MTRMLHCVGRSGSRVIELGDRACPGIHVPHVTGNAGGVCHAAPASVNLRCLYGTPVRSLTIMGPTRRSIGIRPISSITIGCSNKSCSTGTPRLLVFFRRMPLASISDHISPVVQRVPRWRMPPSASGAGSHSPTTSFWRSDNSNCNTVARATDRRPTLSAASRIACTCSSVSSAPAREATRSVACREWYRHGSSRRNPCSPRTRSLGARSRSHVCHAKGAAARPPPLEPTTYRPIDRSQGLSVAQ